jgi:polyisoprenoid-binding protein YceI
VSLPIPCGTYGIDTWHSQLSFAVRHLGISTVRGTFVRYSGSLTVGEDLATTSVSVDAEMGSVASGNPGRDEHLHGELFFDVANHPLMTFRSTSIAAHGEGYVLTGDLTIKGTTLAVSFATTFNGSNVFPVDQSTHFGFTATGTISRSAFGVSYGVPLVSDEVALTLDIQFVQPAPAA